MVQKVSGKHLYRKKRMRNFVISGRAMKAHRRMRNKQIPNCSRSE